MTEKFAKLADLFKPGRAGQSDTGSEIDVSSNGTTSVPPDALAKILRARFAELNGSNADANEPADPAAGAGRE